MRTAETSLIVWHFVSDAPEIAFSPRPGVLRRAADGAWHVVAGFVFLLRHPRLWPLALLPTLLTGLLLIGGFLLGALALSRVDAALAPPPGRMPEWLAVLLTMALWLGTLAAGTFLGLVAALALATPILDLLSQRVEAIVRGTAVAPTPGARWELLHSLRGMAYLAVAGSVVFLLGIVPVVGPLISVSWAAYVLALQQTDGPLARRGLPFAARRGWHRRWRAESLGFGLASLVALLVPLADLLLAPALAVGATLLVLELEDGLVA